MNIFKGKKKYFTIPIVALLGLLFLPLTILFAIVLLVKSKVHNTKIKTVVYSIVGLVALPFIAAYAIAFTSPSATTVLNPTPTPTIEAQTDNIPEEVVIEEGQALGSAEQANEQEYKVTRIIDGDTFEIEGGQRVRLIGIDTPELSGAVECFAREAYDKAVELLEGKNVRLEKDVSETDRYGRLLRYVYLGDTFINRQLVLEGYANASSYPPDIKHQDEFRTAEEEARRENRGLWAGCATPNPAATNTPVQSGGSQGTGNQNPSDGGAYTCSCSKACTAISSCAEAQYQLNVCGCRQRDADADGIACDGAPLNCQN